jgi:TonB family protein
MNVSRLLLIVLALPIPLAAQSGSGGARSAGRDYGVNLTFVVYQYDAQRSPAIDDVVRLSSTFSTPQEEIAYIKDKHKLEEVAVRHVRSVGMHGGETFNDAVLLGPEYMVFQLAAREVIRGHMTLSLSVDYGKARLLETKDLDLDNFETVLLRGGKGMFGLKYFIGAGGSQESVPIERAILVSITPEIVPFANLRNKPQQISQAADEFGNPLTLGESDKFSPPVPTDRVPPKFEAGRAVRGSALLSGLITPEGKVINVRVVRSLDPVIDERAVDAFRQYKFSPGLLNGKPIYATYREEITFSPPVQSAQEIEDEQKKQRDLEKEKQKQKQQQRKRPWPIPIQEDFRL